MSCSSGFLVMNCFNFSMFENNLFCFAFERYFHWVQNSGLSYFSFSTLKISLSFCLPCFHREIFCHPYLCFFVCNMSFSSSWTFKTLLPVLNNLTGCLHVVLLFLVFGVHWISWISGFIISSHLDNFLQLFLQIYFLSPLSIPIFFLNFWILFYFFIQQVLISHQFYIHQCIHVNPNRPIHPTTTTTPRRFPPLVSIHLFSTSVSQFLRCIPVHLYHFSRFHIYTLIYDICFSLSDLFHPVWQSLGPSTSLQMTQFHSILWLSNIPLCICNIFFIHLSVDGHLGCFHDLAIVNSTAMNTGVHVSFWIMFFSGCVPSSGIAGLYATSIFSFLRNLHRMLLLFLVF